MLQNCICGKLKRMGNFTLKIQCSTEDSFGRLHVVFTGSIQYYLPVVSMDPSLSLGMALFLNIFIPSTFLDQKFEKLVCGGCS